MGIISMEVAINVSIFDATECSEVVIKELSKGLNLFFPVF